MLCLISGLAGQEAFAVYPVRPCDKCTPQEIACKPLFDPATAT
jgi:hypothetical protein